MRKLLSLDLPGRVHGQTALLGEPGKQHPDRGHMLLDGWRRARVLLDISRHRADGSQLVLGASVSQISADNNELKPMVEAVS